jgi:uncharacterized membrane protein YeaQ/YmgE (transglycosylase-associated protein family)
LQERNMENLLWFLIIGVVAGWLAGTLMKGGGFGLVGDLIVGIVGAVIGGVVFGALGIGGGGLLGAILMATVGAVILILCLRLLKRA